MTDRLVGDIPVFKPAEQDFETYVERLEHMFVANKITDDKGSHLVTHLDHHTFKLLKTQLSPAKVEDKDYDDLKKVLTDHFSPKPPIIAERFEFWRRDQKQGEKVADFAAELRRLSYTCEFGAFLLEALRDRFVCGLKDIQTQKRLLSVKDLTYEGALETALAAERATQGAQRFTSATAHATANFVSHNRANRCNYRNKQSNTNSHNKSCQSRTNQSNARQSQSSCYRCGGHGHQPSTCRYKQYKCNICNKTGHLAKVCRNKHAGNNYVDAQYVSEDVHDNPNAHESNGASTATGGCDCECSCNPTTSNTYYVNDDTQGDPFGMYKINDDPTGLYNVPDAMKRSNRPILVDVTISGVVITMELDTGSAYTVVPESMHHEYLSHITLHPSKIRLKTYSGEPLPLLGEAHVDVMYGGQRYRLLLLVAKVGVNQPAIFGRDWLHVIKLNWEEVFSHTVMHVSELDSIIGKHPSLFKPGIGTMKHHKATIHIKNDARPVYRKERPVPYALKPQLEAEYARLQREGILVPVNHSEWASPVVPVVKSDGTIRVCGDFKVGLNDSIDVDKYPLPNPQDLFAALAGGKHFSKLDLSQAYQQMELDSESRKYVTISTHMGLFQYTRLPYGISSAPSIFQAAMEQVLQGIDGVLCYLDDILITGSTEQEHLNRLDMVLNRLEAHGLRLKVSKCSFLQPRVEYLGHMIDEQGLHPTPHKVTAILNAQEPRNVTELRSFLGMLQYYSRFLPNLSTMLNPLNNLLQNNVKWEWNERCKTAFKQAKLALASADVLAHYDVNKPLRLAADASPYGIGAVLSHIEVNGEERPIAFVSRTLTKAEQNYSQLEKEGLALIFGVRKFYSYIYGRRFTLVTDHKPLVTILGPKQGIPTLAAARLQRWALILSAHQYDIEYRSTHDHANADALSRLPINSATDHQYYIEEQIYNVSLVTDLPVNATEIAKATQKDHVLSRVLEFTRNGWPNELDEHSKSIGLEPYFHRKTELSVEDNCLLWGRRVIIPQSLRKRILSELHDGHQGICKTKSLARSYVWWPRLDNDIHDMVQNCQICITVRKQPQTTPHIWKWPTAPMDRVHIDFAEHNGQNFLIIVDAHAKWPEVFAMSSTTSKQLCDKLRLWFAAYGLPKVIVSDNGPQLVSEEFETFLRMNRITHVTSPPYHPATNGAAERMVQSVKQSLKRSFHEHSSLSISHRIANFLFAYRNTPHATTGHTPSELFLKRQPRTRLSMVKPCLSTRMQDKQQAANDDGRKIRAFTPGDLVMVRSFRGSDKWKPGVVMQRLGPVSYMVRVEEQLKHVHIDHLIRGSINCRDTPVDPGEIPVEPHVHMPQPQNAHNANAHNANAPLNEQPAAQGQQREVQQPNMQPAGGVQVRRNPPRHCGPPRRLDL